jgi:hypothetical protein
MYFKADDCNKCKGCCKDACSTKSRMNLRRVEVFEPSGVDTYFSSIMLTA